MNLTRVNYGILLDMYFRIFIGSLRATYKKRTITFLSSSSSNSSVQTTYCKIGASTCRGSFAKQLHSFSCTILDTSFSSIARHKCSSPFSTYLKSRDRLHAYALMRMYVFIVACHHPLPLPACCTLFLWFLALPCLQPLTF